jgi:hypothetical protein
LCEIMPDIPNGFQSTKHTNRKKSPS